MWGDTLKEVYPIFWKKLFFPPKFEFYPLYGGLHNAYSNVEEVLVDFRKVTVLHNAYNNFLEVLGAFREVIVLHHATKKVGEVS